jgi:hypothetical protein
VLSQILTDVLQELQMSMTQEMNSHAEKTSSELVKVTDENVALEMEYNKVKQEQDEATKRLKGCNRIREGLPRTPEAQTEMEAPVEEQVTKISEAIQGFHTRIVDLEAHDSEYSTKRKGEKNMVTTVVERIKSPEEECAQLYVETMGI